MAGTLCQQVTVDETQAMAEHAVRTPLYGASLSSSSSSFFLFNLFIFQKKKLKLWTLRQRLHCFGKKTKQNFIVQQLYNSMRNNNTRHTLSAV